MIFNKFQSLYSCGSDSVNSLRILSDHKNYEQKTVPFKPIWTGARGWEECLRDVLPFITVPIVDYDLVLYPMTNL